ncbi:MAG: hemolysin family protein [Candidatus Omnitrophica bacterium]|nr:hemolysin family protein [Candidatus Omnitrophota bacterium]
MSVLLHLPLLLLLLALGILSAFFAIAETSLIGLSKIRLRHMVAKKVKRSLSVQRLLSNSDKFIISILVGNNIINIAMSAILTVIAVQLFGYKWGAVIATLFTAFVILIFCEISPKVLALKHTERTALLVAPVMEFFVWLFDPITRVFVFFSNLWLKIFRIAPVKRSPLITEEEIRLMIEVGRDEGVLTDEEKKMLHRIFEFGDIKINDVMIAKDKIVAINLDSSPEQVLDIFVEEGHARLPVYRDSIDNVVGIIYARDLLYILRDKGLFLLPDVVHSAYYVLGSVRINELLRKFQSEKVQIAIVVDENKKTLGLVTLEDLIEEIVGEIDEQHPAVGSR